MADADRSPSRRAPRSGDDAPDEPHGYKRWMDRGIEWAEDLIYVVVAVLLVVVAGVALVDGVGKLLHLGGEIEVGLLDVLDLLLLVFIVVELLYAVRTTIKRRELLAEPFLLVGIIASIKEIVVLSVKAADDAGTGAAFRDQVIEIGVLGVLVLALALAAYLLRRKEREPREAARSGQGSDEEDPREGSGR